MKINIYNHNGKIAAEKEIAWSFDKIFNPDLVYQVYCVLLANRRRPLAHTKDRSEVRGGGKKPWRQKGTGRARHGSIRSPLWRGGGVTFGPRKERNFKKKINVKTKQLALKMVLNEKIKDKEVMLINDFDKDLKKTKDLDKILRPLIGQDKPKSTLLLIKNENENIKKAGANLNYLDILAPENIDLIGLLNHKYVVVTESAFNNLSLRFK